MFGMFGTPAEALPAAGTHGTDARMRHTQTRVLRYNNSPPVDVVSTGRLYAASLVTAQATARAVTAGGPRRTVPVPMGDSGIERTGENELCALHLRNLPQGRCGNPARPHPRQQDVDIALDIDCYDSAIKIRIEGSHPIARMKRAGR
jgi:hypothetical protein